jgi:hypothetical protein
MNTAPIVEKRDLSGFREAGSVGMSGNGQDQPPVEDPFLDPFFNPYELLIIPGWGGGVGNPPNLKGLPKDPHHESTHAPTGVIPPVGLVPVAKEEFLPGFFVFKDQGLMVSQPPEEFLVFPVYRLKIRAEVFFQVVRVPVDHVVVSPDHMKAVLPVEFFKQLIDILMSLKNGIEMEVLPELIPVPEFDVVISLVEILLQRMVIDVAVFCKFIRKTIVAPMAIAEQDKS